MKSPKGMAPLLFMAWVAVSAVAAMAGDRELEPAKGPVETVKEFVAANEVADLARILDTLDDRATVFFPGVRAPRASGKAEIRTVFAEIFSRRTGPIAITVRDIEVQSFGDMAIVTAHLAASPSVPVLEPTVFPRRTFVLRLLGGRWLIVHHHASNYTIEPVRP